MKQKTKVIEKRKYLVHWKDQQNWQTSSKTDKFKKERRWIAHIKNEAGCYHYRPCKHQKDNKEHSPPT